MRQFFENNFTRIVLAVSVVVLVVICLRAWFIPITHDEAATFFYYVQCGEWRPYQAHAWTNNHVLNSLLASFSFKAFGSHPFALRLPNILSFIFFAWGVLRLCNRHFTTLAGRVTLLSLTVLTFNLLDFFALCRGYGLSIAMMILGLSFLQDYFSSRKVLALVVFSVCWQLALLANLTLVLCIAVLLPLIWMNQLAHRDLMKPFNLGLQAVNVWLLLKSVRLALWYKSVGVLVSGAGHDYWGNTFKSLMDLVFGTNAGWIQLVTVFLVLICLVQSARTLLRERTIGHLFRGDIFYTLVLVLLIAAFYAQRWLLKVHYPDDRTALVIYIAFLMAASFTIDRLSRPLADPFSAIIVLYSATHFLLAFNLRTFTHFFYHVMPGAFIDRLAEEQRSAGRIITLGGQSTREMNYAFANYRKEGRLNDMILQDYMHMNCDYYYARRFEAPYYRHFYDEILSDDWDRVLLKRKETIVRNQIAAMTRSGMAFEGTGAFFNFLNAAAPPSVAGRCVEAEIDLSFLDVPAPYKAFIVLEIRGQGSKPLQYHRALLNHTADELSGRRKVWRLVSAPLPSDPSTIMVYLWNVKEAQSVIRLNSLRISELKGKGVERSVPAEYSKMADWRTSQL